MKNPLFLILIICTLISCNSNNNDLNKLGLKGKIKSYTEETYKPLINSDEIDLNALSKHKDCNFEKIEKQKNLRQDQIKQMFDENGNFTRKLHFDVNGKLSYKSIVTKQHNGIVVTKKYNNKNELLTKTISTYHSDGNEEHITYDNGNEIMTIQKCFRDDKKLETNFFLKDQKTLIGNILIEFNNDNQISKIKVLGKNSIIVENTECEYTKFDENNNWTKRIDYDMTNGKMVEKIVVRKYEYY